MAPQAPLRSRTVGFPESGSDLGTAHHFPGAGLPRPLKAQAMARIHPQSAELAGPLAPRPKFTAVPGSVSGAAWVVGTAECPGPLCLTGALPTPGRSLGPPRGTLLPLQSSYGLMRQSHHLSSLSGYLMRRVSAGCCHPLLVVGPSRHYPRDPCGGDWTHTPPCPPGAFTHFFPGGVGLTLRERRSAHGTIPAMRLQQGARLRGCSHSLMFNLPHLLDLPVAPTAVPEGTGRPGRLHHASPGGLPRPGCGIAT